MNFKNFSAFHTFYSHRIETLCIALYWRVAVTFHVLMLLNFFSRVLEKSLNSTVFWIFWTFLHLLHWNLVYRFVGKSYSSNSLFSGIDLLFCTEINGRIMPRLHCSCFNMFWIEGLFVSLFVYSYLSNFSAIQQLSPNTITSDKAANLDLCLAPVAFSSATHRCLSVPKIVM
jgi:hypothetical protein